MSFPVPENEVERLEALHRLQILDTPPQPEFDELAELTRDIFDVPISLVSLMDRSRQWFKAASGLDADSTPREAAFCNYTISSSNPFIVSDASRDERFYQNPYVTGDLNIRFYAGVPVALDPGVNLGSICIIDSKPRQMTKGQVQQLRKLGNIVQSLLREHRSAYQITQQSETLAGQKWLLDKASDLAKIGAWQRNLTTGTMEWTDGMFAIHEMDRGDLINIEQQLMLYPEPDRSRLKLLMERSIREGIRYDFEGRMYTTKGNLRWVRMACEVELQGDRVVRRFGMKQDITEEKSLSDRIHRMAYTDDLTGLCNRRALREKLAKLDNAEGAKSPVVLFSFDIDGFKDVNDVHGHAAGDACLRRVSRRVKIVTGKDAFLARVGGDEFSILQTSDDALSPETFAARVQQAISKPIVWRGQSFHLTSSIGYASRRAGEIFNTDDLIREADLAMFEAKAAGRNCYRAYHCKLGSSAVARNDTLRMMRQALAEKRLELYYQSKVRLRDRKLMGFECLLRLNKPDGTVAAPGAFAAALEDTALSKKIGEFVIKTALDQAREWQLSGLQFGSIAINLSSSQFRDPAFADNLLLSIKDRGLPASAIEVEVTEGIFLSANIDNVLTACRTLHDGGVRIAFDDFGTGFASLTHLRDFPVDVLKIDRSFISDLEKGGSATAIVNAMVSLGQNLSMCVVAEGIETVAQAEFLRAIGCEQGQGYLYSRPLPVHAASALIDYAFEQSAPAA